MVNNQGIYFIAAGNSSKNRKKTLEKSWSLDQIKNVVPSAIYSKLQVHFPTGNGIYAWGANEGSLKELSQVRSGEFVIDVKNKEIVQAFKFCFMYKTQNSKIQELFGWDSEKPRDERRPYKLVYFLSSPTKMVIKSKDYFKDAFEQTNSQWLVGQKYFDKYAVQDALKLKNLSTIEEFLGIRNKSKPLEETPNKPVTNPPKPAVSVPKPGIDTPKPVKTPKSVTTNINISKTRPQKPKLTFWQWLVSLFK